MDKQRVYMYIAGIYECCITIIGSSMTKHGAIQLRSLQLRSLQLRSPQRVILVLFMAFMALTVLPACSSTEEQPASTGPSPSADADETVDTSEPPPPSGGSDDCVVDDQQPLRWECLRQ